MYGKMAFFLILILASPPTLQGDQEDFGRIIDNINQRNSKIQNIVCDDIQIFLRQSKMPQAKLKAQLKYSKTNNFRLLVASKTGKEMDLGSNRQYFWFWSRRMKHKVLYYAKHQDVHKTRLKQPLNPNWIIESLNLNEIQVENSKIGKFKQNIIVFNTRPDKTTLVTLINPKEQIIGKYLYNKYDRLEVSCEVTEFDENSLPKKMLIIWYQEDIEMNWIFNDIKIVKAIDFDWKMPNITPKKNLADD